MASPLGQRLKAARERRCLSLPDAAHATRIPVIRLLHLEQDNYAAFGSLTYARAFLRVYSRFLAVDAEEMLEDLPGGVLGGPRDYRYLTDSHGPWVPPRDVRVQHLASPVYRRQAKKSPVPAGIAIFVLVLAGTGIWGKYVADENASLARHQQEPAPVVTKTDTQPQPVSLTDAPLGEASDLSKPRTMIRRPLRPTPEEIEAQIVELAGKGRRFD